MNWFHVSGFTSLPLSLTSSWLPYVEILADSAFVQPPSDSEGHHGVRPSSPSSHCPASPNGHLKPLGETLRPKEPPSPAVYPDKARGPSEGPASKRSSSLLNSLRPPHPLQAKEGPHSINGRTKPWDSFTPEEFAQQFHESVLQSTQKALQKHKGKQHQLVEMSAMVVKCSRTFEEASSKKTCSLHVCQWHIFFVEKSVNYHHNFAEPSCLLKNMLC